MSTTPKTGITELNPSAANQAPVVNSGWAIVDQLLDRTVKDKDLATPPGSPTDGDAYIVAGSPTGAWSGKANQIAYWRSSANAWQFIVPRAGWVLRVADELDGNGIPKEYGYTGSAWAIPLGSSSFTGGTLTSALNEAPLVTLASASTVSIGAAAANTINISGTTTIIAFDVIPAGAERKLVFQGALTLTHHATAQILPTGANITTAAGDVAEFVALGSGNWRCTSYTRANGQALATAGGGFTGGTLTSALNEAPPVALASASTVNIGAAAANTISVTGTTTITAFDTIAAGAVRTLEFAAALTLTHNATSLILPTASNITTAAGDVAVFRSLGSGNWKCTDYMRASGAALASSGGGLTNWTDAISTASPNNTRSAASLTATGAASDIDAVLAPKGTGSILAQVPTGSQAGGNKRGLNAVDFQINRSISTQIAQGDYSVLLGGASNTISANYGVLGGGASNTVGGQYAFVGGGQSNGAFNQHSTVPGGFQCSASANYAAVGGGNSNTSSGTSSCIPGGESGAADGAYSAVLGGLQGTARGIYGAEARASGMFATQGDAQRRRFIQRVATTNATTTTLTNNGSTASGTALAVLPANSAFAFSGKVVARAGTTMAAWEFKGAVRRGSGGTSDITLVGTPAVTSIGADAGASSWVLAVDVDVTYGAVILKVTGAAATNIKWVADLETVEVVG